MPRETIGNTFLVAGALCVVCSVLVSGAAVGLRPAQQRNKVLEIRKNIIQAAGLVENGSPSSQEITDVFESKVERRLVDLSTGDYLAEDDLVTAGIDPKTYDQFKAANDPELSVEIPPEADLAGIKRREIFSYVYLIKKDDGQLDQIVLPIRGKGLWSTLYGFLSIDSDTQTIRGLTFYQHGETPGLGGEVDNPGWKAQWDGKLAYESTNGDREVAIRVIKGKVDESSPNAEHQIDGLSGATITSNGVTNLVRYWLGDQGFGPFLQKLRAGEAHNG